MPAKQQKSSSSKLQIEAVASMHQFHLPGISKHPAMEDLAPIAAVAALSVACGQWDSRHGRISIAQPLKQCHTTCRLHGTLLRPSSTLLGSDSAGPKRRSGLEKCNPNHFLLKRHEESRKIAFVFSPIFPSHTASQN